MELTIGFYNCEDYAQACGHKNDLAVCGAFILDFDYQDENEICNIKIRVDDKELFTEKFKLTDSYYKSSFK